MLNKFFGAEEGASNEEILQNLLEQKESENKELKKRVQALTDSLHRDAPDSASENHALREALTQAQQELSQIVMNGSTSTHEREESARQVQHWRERWEAKEAESVQLLAERDGLSLEVDRLRDENAAMQVREQSALERIAALERELAAAASRADLGEAPSAPGGRSDLDAQLQALEGRCAELAEENAALRESSSKQKDSVALAAETTDPLEAHFAEHLNTERKSADEVTKEKIETLEVQLEIRSAEADELRATVAAWLDQKREYENEVSALRAKLHGDGAAAREAQSLRDNIEMLEIENGNLNRENSELREQVATAAGGAPAAAAAPVVPSAPVEVMIAPRPAARPPIPESAGPDELREELEELQEMLEVEQRANDRLRKELDELRVAASKAASAVVSPVAAAVEAATSSSSVVSSFAQDMEMQKLRSDLAEEKKKSSELTRQLGLLEDEVERRAKEVRELSKATEGSPSNSKQEAAGGPVPRVSDGWGDDAWTDDDDVGGASWPAPSVGGSKEGAATGATSVQPAATVVSMADQDCGWDDEDDALPGIVPPHGPTSAAASAKPKSRDMPVAAETLPGVAVAGDDGWGDEDLFADDSAPAGSKQMSHGSDAAKIKSKSKDELLSVAVPGGQSLQEFSIASPEEGNTPMAADGTAMVRMEVVEQLRLELEEQRRLVSHLNAQLEAKVRAQSQQSELAGGIERENAELVEQNRHLTANMDSLATQFEAVQAAKEQLEAQVQASSQQIASLEREKDELKVEVATASQNVSMMSESSPVADLTQEKDRLATAIARITEELAEKETEKSAILVREAEVGKQLDETKLALVSAEQARQAIDQRLQAVMEQFATVQADAERLQAANVALQAQADRVAAAPIAPPVLATAPSAPAGLNTEDDDGWAFGDESDDAILTAVAAPASSGENQPGTSSQQVSENAKNKTSAEVDRLTAACNQLTGERTRLETEKGELEQRLQAVDAERTGVAAAAEQWRAKAEELQTQVSRLREELMEASKESEARSRVLAAGAVDPVVAVPEVMPTAPAPPAPAAGDPDDVDGWGDDDDDGGWDFDDDSPMRASKAKAGDAKAPAAVAPSSSASTQSGGSKNSGTNLAGVPAAPPVAAAKKASNVPSDPLTASVEARMPSAIRLSDGELDWSSDAPDGLKLETRLRETEMRYEELRKKFADAEKEFQEQQTELETERARLLEVVNETTARQSVVDQEKTQQIARLEDDLRLATAAVAGKEAELAAAREAAGAKEANFLVELQQTKQRAAADAEARLHAATEAAVLARVQGVEAQFAAQIRERDEAVAAAGNESRAQIERLNQTVQSKEDEIASMLQQIDQLSQALSSLQNEKDAADLLASSSAGEADAKAGAVQQLESTVAELRVELESARAAKGDVEQQLASAVSLQLANAGDLERLRAEFGTSKAELESELARVDGEKQELARQVDELRRNAAEIMPQAAAGAASAAVAVSKDATAPATDAPAEADPWAALADDDDVWGDDDVGKLNDVLGASGAKAISAAPPPAAPTPTIVGVGASAADDAAVQQQNELLTQAQEKTAKLEQDVAELQAALERERAEVSSVERNLEETAASLQQAFDERLEAARSEKTAAEDDKVVLAQRFADTAAELEFSKQKCAAGDASIARLEAALAVKEETGQQNVDDNGAPASNLVSEEAAAATHAAEIEQLKSAHQQALSDLQARHEDSLLTEREKVVITLQEDFSTQLAEMQKRHETTLADQREAFERRICELEESQAAAMASAEETWRAKLGDVAERGSSGMEEATAAHQAELAALESAHAAKIHELDAAMTDRMKQEEIRHVSECNELKAAHEQEVANLQVVVAASADEKTAEASRFQEQIATLSGELKQESDRYSDAVAQVSRLQARLDELGDSRALLAEAEQRLRHAEEQAAEARRAAAEAEGAAQRGAEEQVAAARAQFEERERQLQEREAELLNNADLAEVTRARDALQLQLEASTRRYQETLTQARTEIETKSRQLVELETELGTSKENLVRAQKNLGEVNSENDSLMEELEEKEAKLMEYESQGPPPPRPQGHQMMAPPAPHPQNGYLYNATPNGGAGPGSNGNGFHPGAGSLQTGTSCSILSNRGARLKQLQEQVEMLEQDVEVWKEREQLARDRGEDILRDGEAHWLAWEREKEELAAEKMQIQQSAKQYIAQSRQAYLRLKKEGGEWCANLEKQITLLRAENAELRGSGDERGSGGAGSKTGGDVDVVNGAMMSARMHNLSDMGTPVSHIREVGSPHPSEMGSVATFLALGDEKRMEQKLTKLAEVAAAAETSRKQLADEAEGLRTRCVELEEELRVVKSAANDAVASGSAAAKRGKKTSVLTDHDPLGMSVRTCNLHGTPQIPNGTPLIVEEEDGWDWEDDDGDAAGARQGREQRLSPALDSVPEADSQTESKQSGGAKAESGVALAPPPDAQQGPTADKIVQLEADRMNLQAELQSTQEERQQLEDRVSALKKTNAALEAEVAALNKHLKASKNSLPQKPSKESLPSPTDAAATQGRALLAGATNNPDAVPAALTGATALGGAAGASGGLLAAAPGADTTGTDPAGSAEASASTNLDRRNKGTMPSIAEGTATSETIIVELKNEIKTLHSRIESMQSQEVLSDIAELEANRNLDQLQKASRTAGFGAVSVSSADSMAVILRGGASEVASEYLQQQRAVMGMPMGERGEREKDSSAASSECAGISPGRPRSLGKNKSDNGWDLSDDDVDSVAVGTVSSASRPRNMNAKMKEAELLDDVASRGDASDAETAQLQRRQLVEQMLLGQSEGVPEGALDLVGSKENGFDPSHLRAFSESLDLRERTITEMQEKEKGVMAVELEEKFSLERADLLSKIRLADAKREELSKQLEIVSTELDEIKLAKEEFENLAAKHEASATASQIELNRIKQQLEDEQKRSSIADAAQAKLRDALTKASAEKQGLQKKLQMEIQKMEQHVASGDDGAKQMLAQLRAERDQARALAQQFHTQLRNEAGKK